MSKYVYGVVAASAAPRVGSSGIGGSVVQTIAGDGAAALVSDVPDEELVAGRDELMIHARVLEEAFAEAIVLPMRFGLVMPSEDGVRRELLERHRDELLSQLERFEGKVELRVRASYEETALMREVVLEDSEIAGLRESLKGQPEDATYYERIRLGEMVAQAVERKRAHDAQRILDALEPLSLALDVSELSHKRIAVNASFLVQRGRIEEFDRAVDEIGRRESGRIRLKYTGPLPPHSFVELSVQG